MRAAAALPAMSGAVESELSAAKAALRRHWGHQGLRQFQEDALRAWAEGRDSIVTLATGAGKSVCFQLPPLCRPRCWALVISPLISLMQDQVHTLRQRQIPAALCGSGADSSGWGPIASGRYRVVYMCPEFALSHLSDIAANRNSVCVLAIDEAHCISTWGHDFRPVYQKLYQLREALGRVPTMCLTATCSQEVRSDIQKSLNFSGCVSIVGPMNRPNLKYVVRPRTSFEADFTEIFGLSSLQGERVIDNTTISPTSSSIVYVQTKSRANELAASLKRAGVSAEAYHAGIGMQDRHRIHRAFLMDELQVVVATIAFGMGIDKSSIRRVVHYGGARSLENYVQQSGRAGRDGEDAECITFFKPQDVQEAKTLIVQECDGEHGSRMLALHSKLAAFLSDSSQCRRVRLLQQFDEEPRQLTSQPNERRKGECIKVAGQPACCAWCDVCLAAACKPAAASQEGDFTQECRILLQCVSACGGMTGLALPCALAAGQANDKLRAKNLHRHRAFGSGGHKAHSWWKAFIPHVLHAGMLQERPATLSNGRSYAALSVSAQGSRLLHSQLSGLFRLSPVPAELAAPAPKPAPVALRSRGMLTGTAVQDSAAVSQSFSEIKKQELYSRLSHIRQQWMRRLNIMGESLVSNPVLRMLAEVRPSSVQAAQDAVPGLPTLLTEQLSSLLEALVAEVGQMCKECSLPQDVAVHAKPADEPPRHWSGQRMQVPGSIPSFKKLEDLAFHADPSDEPSRKRPEEMAVNQDRTPKFRRLPTTFGTGPGYPGKTAGPPLDVQQICPSEPSSNVEAAAAVAPSDAAAAGGCSDEAAGDDWLSLLDT